MSFSSLWALALTAFFSGSMASTNSYYRGAVVDYHVAANSGDARASLMNNVKNFEAFIKNASNNQADIIVFPEGALNGGDHTIFIAVPNPADKVVPAGNASWDEALQNISSFANNSKMYVVVNLHENYTDPNTKEVLKYNTNVVFDRNGTVISRYRKYHPYGEAVNVTKEPEYATFDTDFGVTFGQFICFDILFKEPALNLVKNHKIKNFVYPTWWFSELPFLTAPQAQWSWAVGNNVNLLAAGVNAVTSGSSGSSIIRGRSGYWGDANYVFSNKTGNTLIIANIPKDPSVIDSSFVEYVSKTFSYEKTEAFAMVTQPGLENFNSANIDLPTNGTSRRFVSKLCHNDKLCCDFDLNVTYENTLTDTIAYKAVAYSGDRVFGIANGEHGIQICGVYAFSSSAANNMNQIAFGSGPVRKVEFTNVKISGNFRTSNSEILPNVLLNPGSTESFLPPPSDVTFTTGDSSVLTYNPKKQLIAVGIHSRTFQKNSAHLASVSNLALLLPAIIAAFFNRKLY